MSDANQLRNIDLPLSINIGPRLRPVTQVLSELEDLDTQKEMLESQISTARAEPEIDIGDLDKLERQLASVESAIELRDSPIKIRHGHLYRRPTANSA